MKTNYRSKILSAGLILFLAFNTGCYYDQVSPEVDLGDDPVSYSTDMQPFFDSKCVSCHNGTGVPLNLEASVSYNNLMTGGTPPYVNVGDPASSSLYTKIAPGGSMANYASPTETAMTLKWIEEGALNN